MSVSGFLCTISAFPGALLLGHVAQELVRYLADHGANVEALDSRGVSAEERANGMAKNAFLELRGFSFESHERYEGSVDSYGRPHGNGRQYIKLEGYCEQESLLYDGGFFHGRHHGHGVLHHKGRSRNVCCSCHFCCLRSDDATKVHEGNCFSACRCVHVP